MRFPVLTAAVLLAAAPAAFAFQEPAPIPAPAPKTEEPAPAPAPAPAAPVAAAPAKRENKISPEAKALLDAAQKVVYSPVALGLKELKSTVVMKIQIPNMDESVMEGMPELSIKFVLGFTAPKTLSIEGSTDHPGLMGSLDQFKTILDQSFKIAMGILEPSEPEFDMEVATEGTSKVLVIKIYKGATVQTELRLVPNADGLPTKGSLKFTEPNMGMEQTLELTMRHVKDGDRYRLESQSMSMAQMPEPFESKFTYTDAEGIKIPTGMETAGPQGMKFLFKCSELSVNGKKVMLAEPKKEEAAPAAAPPAVDPSKSEPAPAPAPAPAEKKPE